MEHIPENSRPYEKCLAYGPSVLGDDELIAVILRTGVKGEQVMEVARNILQLSKTTKGVAGIMDLTLPELKQLRGIGDVKAIQIQCIGELSRRIWMQKKEERMDCHKPSTIAEYYSERMRHEEREIAIVVFLDTKKKRIADMVISIGSLNETIVSSREIYREALRYNAASIILLHNHPSGDPTPSNADLQTTLRLKKAGQYIGISLIDHIVIGDNSYISFKEKGVI